MAKWQRLTESNAYLAELDGAADQWRRAGDARRLALAERFARPLLGPAATAGVVLIFTLVILLYSEDLRDRFVRLVGRHDLHRTIFALNDAGRRLSRYFLSQLTINAGVRHVRSAAALALVGLPGAILLGLLAMLMRFVPFVGTFIALWPAARARGGDGAGLVARPDRAGAVRGERAGGQPGDRAAALRPQHRASRRWR